MEALRRRLERENAPDDLLADVWLVELSRLLPELRERYPDLPPPTPDETLGRIRLSEAVTRLGKALARQQPVVLYLDDIQWADAASLDLIHYACRVWSSEQNPILLLLTLRTESLATSPEVGDWLSALGRDVALTQIPLSSLTAEETKELIGLLGKEQGRETKAAPAIFAQWLYKETAGQPFFINETIRALSEQDQTFGAIPSAGMLPPGVRKVIMTRLAHLSPAATALLTASTEAPHKTKLICQQMLNLAQQSGWPTLECAALNRLASLAIYAQQMDRAMALLTQAKQVAETSDDKAGLAQTEWSLGQLTHHIDDFKASQAYSERALALAREIGDQALIAGTTQTLAFALLFQGQLAAGQAAMAEAREGYLTLGNRALEADALVGLTMPYLLNGETAKGVESARSAYTIGQEIENEFSQCMSRSWLVCGLVDQGNYEEALAIAQYNLAVARSQALAPKLLAAFSAGLLYWALGDFATAQEGHLELMPYLEEAGVPAYLEQNLANSCVDAALAGDWDAAHTHARQALSYRDYRTLPLLIKPHWPETEALLRGGDVESAREDARRWGELAGEIPRFRVGYLRSLALLAEWDGDVEQAIAYLQEAFILAEAIGLPGEQWQILVNLTRLYRANENEVQAQQAVAEAVEIVQALIVKLIGEGLQAGFLAACGINLTNEDKV